MSKKTTKQANCPENKEKLLKEKRQVYRLISRIYKELRNDQPIILRKMRGFQGEYDFNNDEITLDYRNDILSTLIHEFLHKFYPENHESWILERERFIVQRLSLQQVKRLLIALGNASS